MLRAASVFLTAIVALGTIGCCERGGRDGGYIPLPCIPRLGNEPTPTVFSGVVLDHLTNEAVPDAVVTIRLKDGATIEQAVQPHGVFQILTSRRATELRVQANGYKPHVMPVRARVGETIHTKILLVRIDDRE